MWLLGILLTVTFVTLRLTEVIDWSWLWVVSPLAFGAMFHLALVALLAGLSVWVGTKE